MRPDTRLDHLGIPRLSLVLDEVFGVLPPHLRNPEDPPLPETIGDLQRLTQLGFGKLCERLARLVLLCRDLDAIPPFDISIGNAPGKFQLSYEQWIEEQLRWIPQITSQMRIGIATGNEDLDFSLCLYLRQIEVGQAFLCQNLSEGF